MGVYSETKHFFKWLAFNLKSLSNLFPINIGDIKGIFLLLQNVFRMDQYVLELVEGWDNLLANLSQQLFFGIIY